jgi:hypothetical protein
LVAFIGTEQAPVPVHAPDQPANVEPAAGTGVRATLVPLAKSCEHVDPQSIPEGELLTVPAPFPDLSTESV